MSDGDGDANSGKGVLIFSVGITALIFGGLFLYGHLQGPAGYDGAYISGQYVIGDGYTWDDGDKYTRLAVHELSTGKRLEQRDPPGRMSALGVVNGLLWFQHFAPRGLEAWSLPDLKTKVSWEALQKTIPELQTGLADENLCFEPQSGHVRAKLLDGRWLTLDLTTQVAVADRQFRCGDLASGASSGVARADGGWLGLQHQPGSERRKLAQGQEPNRRLIAPNLDFLEPEYLTISDRAIELGDDVLVLHRQSLDDKSDWHLSRVAIDRVVWTVPVGTERAVHDVAFAGPDTLVLSRGEHVFVIDVGTGQLKWKAPN